MERLFACLVGSRSRRHYHLACHACRQFGHGGEFFVVLRCLWPATSIRRHNQIRCGALCKAVHQCDVFLSAMTRHSLAISTGSTYWRRARGPKTRSSLGQHCLCPFAGVEACFFLLPTCCEPHCNPTARFWPTQSGQSPTRLRGLPGTRATNTPKRTWRVKGGDDFGMRGPLQSFNVAAISDVG